MSESSSTYYRPTQPSMHRRANFHDYCERGIYMLTLVTDKRQRVFGSLAGDVHQPSVALSLLGQAVEDAIAALPSYYPQIEVLAHLVMPDHLHIVIYVHAPLPIPLGKVISGFKQGLNRRYWQELGILPLLSSSRAELASTERVANPPEPSGAAEFRSAVGVSRPSLFEAGFHDRILSHRGQLNAMIAYVHDNPRRALWRQLHPELFRVVQHARVGERDCALFGNLFLLRQPYKRVVMCHRWHMVSDGKGGEQRDYHTPYETTPEFGQQRESLLREARDHGAVLVSGAISKGEQTIVADALTQHLPVIILQKEPITSPYWKPARNRFEACSDGLLLIIAPTTATAGGDYEGVDAATDYAIFHNLNTWAERIANEQLPCVLHTING